MVLRTNLHSAFRVVEEDGAYLVRFAKDVSFLNKNKLKTVLSQIPNGSEVVIDGTQATFIDHDIYEVLEDFLQSALHRELTVSSRNVHLRRPGFEGTAPAGAVDPMGSTTVVSPHAPSLASE